MLKNDRMKDKEKKKEVEGLLGSLADERFALLVNLGKKISDWGQEERKESKALRLLLTINKKRPIMCFENMNSFIGRA